MKTPCEFSMWYIVPYIRSRVAQSMVQDLGMKQAHAARKLGVTDAAVSQYLSGKRAKTEMDEAWLIEELRTSAKTISNTEKEEDIGLEICRVCKLVQESDFMDKLAQGSCGKCP